MTGTPPKLGTDDLTAMKQYAEKMERQLAEVRSQLTQAGTQVNRHVAVIDQAACSLCGACVSSCPRNAIRLAEAVEVDTTTCTGCGACVRACPANAIRLAAVD
jgi:NAD-dependent dihydropyrimidine dehydrogenase PreA subunit